MSRMATFTGTDGYVYNGPGPWRMVMEECYLCGIPFAMPDDYKNRRREDRRWFYCPNGHQQHYLGETDAQKLQAERERSARLAAENDQLEASNRAQRGAATRARNQRDRLERRAKAGACPCCNRTFKQLARHMQSQHPDFVPGEERAA